MMINITDKERGIFIIALSNLDALLEAPDPMYENLVKHIREFLRHKGIKHQDIKDLAVKLGVSERSVYAAGRGLQ